MKAEVSSEFDLTMPRSKNKQARKGQTTLVVNQLPSLDGIAKDLKDSRTPYRDAFKSLKRAVR
jgi:hypothetical protein